MPSIDERVVSMAFENAKFEQGVATTLASLGKLDSAIRNLSPLNNLATGLGNVESAAHKVNLEAPISALDRFKSALGKIGSGAAAGFGMIETVASKVHLSGPLTALDKLRSAFGRGVTQEATDSFASIEKASDRVELRGIARAVDNISSKFTVLQGAASVALGNIASQAAMRGGAFTKSFAFGPIQQGLEEYQTNLNSIQTILANTEGQQVSGLGEVNSHLAELNDYSDKTIYNFSQMARNIGTFTAAGVDLDKSTQSIKGIANLAALSGSSSEQASTAMYQLSQAIASGRVGLQDWNSVVNAGMGGAKFQQALMRTAENMGSVEKGAIKIDSATGKATVNGQSFRESIMAKPGQESWLTSDVLTSTLQQFTGDMKEADLIAQGFSANQAKAIMQQAKTAQAAATEVKTLSQVFDVARESIGSGWAQTFQLIFGDFQESKQLFTGLSNFINGFIGRMSDARNALLGEWKELGGRTALIEGIKSAFGALIAILSTVRDAFRDIFPARTGKDLFELTVQFRNFADSVREWVEGHGEDLQRTFRGLFALLHIGVTIIKAVAGVIGTMLGVVSQSSGGILEFTGSLGDFLVGLDAAISKGESLGQFFDGLSAVLQAPLALIKAVASAIGSIFGGADSGDASAMATNMLQLQKAAGPLGGIFAAVVDGLDRLHAGLKKVAGFLEPIFNDALETVSSFGDRISTALKSINFDDAMQALTTAGIGGIFLVLKKAIGGGVELKFFDNVKQSVVETLNAVNGSLSALQKNIQANTLLQIGAAVLVLAGGILILSKIDPKELTKAMTAVAVGLGQLVGAIKLLGSAGGAASLAVMPLVAAALIGMATAMVILAGAVTILSKLSWEEIAKGLAGVGGGVAAIALGVRAMPPSLILIGPAMIPLAIALNIMAVAMKVFATMSWEDMAKGLIGIGGGLAAIGAATSLMGPSMILIGPGLVAVGAGLILISAAMATFGNLGILTIAQGLAGMAGALLIIATAVAMMPPTMAAQAAGLVILGVALNIIAGALAIIGTQNIGTLIKGLTAIAGALVIFAFGLTAMSGTLPGSVALLAAAAGLAVLTPVLITLGNMDWGTLLKGLAVMALSIGVIAAVSVVAGPALIMLGAGLLALGLGLAAIAGAVYLAAKGIALLSDTGQKGVAVLLVALTGFVAMIPTIVIEFIKGLVVIAEEIAKVAPKVAIALGVVIDSLLATIIEAAPKIAIAAGSLIDGFLQIIITKAPALIEAGWNLLVAFLKGINDHIGEVVAQVGQIVTKFLAQLTIEAPKIVAAGAQLLVAYLRGITSHLAMVIVAAGQLVVKFLEGVTAQLPKIVVAGVRLITQFLNTIAEGVPKVIRSGTNIIVNFLEGLSRALPRIVDAGVDVVVKFIRAVGKETPRIADAGFKALIDFLHGLARAIRENRQDLLNAGLDIAKAIVDGIVDGLGFVAQKVVKPVVEKLFNLLPNFAKKLLGIKSPSSVFRSIGENVMLGLADGVSVRQATVNAVLGKALNSLIKQTGDAKQFGKFLGGDFATGLLGTQQDIEASFKALRDKLKEEQAKLGAQIQKDRDRLAKERARKHPRQAIIDDLQEDIRLNGMLLTASRNATNQLMAGFQDEKAALLSLSTEFQTVSSALEKAQTALDDAVKTRDNAVKSFTDQYSQLPNFDEDATNQVATYKQAIAQQIIATEKFMATLQKLREIGLDDTTYQRLLKEGVKDQTFADQLLAGGKASVDELNKLDAELVATSAGLATQAASNLYQAGVDAAQGLVDGLKTRQAEIQTAMNNIASAMVQAIKQQLGIRSPSQVLAEVGRFAAEGVISGLKGASGAVADAAAGIGDEAAAAMSDSLARISESVSAEIDVNPTITPVLDLSQVQKEATKLSDLTNVVPITAAASYGQATAISGERDLAAKDAAAAAEAAAVTQFNFEQNNYSPETLSDIEIYRQTNNQLSQVKKALGVG